MRKFLKILAGILGVAVLAFLASILFFNKLLPQNEHDVPIVERTIELLNDESIWNRDDDRNCGLEGQGLSLFCALQLASFDIAGEFKSRSAALQQVRYAIERQNPHTDYDHRLIDYNNDPETSFEDMHEMLQDALARLKRSES